MSTTQYGSKYNRDLDVTAIAKLVRADIKAAIAAGTIPAAKYSVRVSRYSGGQSITVDVKGVPFRILSAARVLADYVSPHVYNGIHWMSDEARGLESTIEAMLAAYNFDGSDSMSDYFHVNFYTHVSIDGCMPRDEERAAIIDERHEAINAQERAEVMADLATETVANDTTDQAAAFEAFLARCDAVSL